MVAECEMSDFSFGSSAEVRLARDVNILSSKPRMETELV